MAKTMRKVFSLRLLWILPTILVTVFLFLVTPLDLVIATAVFWALALPWISTHGRLAEIP